MTTDEASLYHHVKRPEWGLSTIVAMDEDRATYVFEDGTRRVIMRGHMHLMERVLTVDATTEEAQRKLAKYTRTSASSSATSKRPRASKRTATT